MTSKKLFLKWVGGKTQILNELFDKFPKEINNYYEPFLGGGSVLFELLNRKTQNKIKIKGNIYVYDINNTLIGLYKNIQNNPEELHKEIEKYKTIYDSIKLLKSGNMKPNTETEAVESKETYYYWLRKLYNLETDNTSLKKSALFCLLNKLCFRGLYREGPNGFNVPYGNYKTYYIPSKETFIDISKLLKDVVFTCLSYENVINKQFNNDDFIYMDPPYVPEKKDSFVSYNIDGFNKDKHTQLFQIIKALKCKFMMSNSYTQDITDTFNDSIYTVKKIECKRSINSKKPGSKTFESITVNYNLETENNI